MASETEHAVQNLKNISCIYSIISYHAITQALFHVHHVCKTKLQLGRASLNPPRLGSNVSKITRPLSPLTPLWAKSGGFKLARPSCNAFTFTTTAVDINIQFIVVELLVSSTFLFLLQQKFFFLVWTLQSSSAPPHQQTKKNHIKVVRRSFDPRISVYSELAGSTRLMLSEEI